jgi:hypothetical protein
MITAPQSYKRPLLRRPSTPSPAARTTATISSTFGGATDGKAACRGFAPDGGID